MGHGAVIHSRRTGSVGAALMPLLTPLLVLMLMLLLMLLVLLGMPTSVRAADQPPAPGAPATTPGASPAATTPVGAKLVAPADGHHFDRLEVAPMVQFDPSTNAAGKAETPKWVLLAADRAMTKTVRYCRQFVWAMTDGVYRWGCNRWATGANQYGSDQLRPLDPGTVYYWQVVSSSADGASEVKSAVRSFTVDPETAQPTIADVSAQVNGTAFDDGTYLNLGAAALVNSGVRVSTIESARLATYAFRITGRYVGAVDLTRSYVKVASAAGTRYLKVAGIGSDGTVQAVWRLSPTERRLRTKRFTYQLYLKSAKNGAMVKSQQRVVLLKSPAATPKWTPDRTTVKPI